MKRRQANLIIHKYTYTDGYRHRHWYNIHKQTDVARQEHAQPQQEHTKDTLHHYQYTRKKNWLKTSKTEKNKKKIGKIRNKREKSGKEKILPPQHAERMRTATSYGACLRRHEARGPFDVVLPPS